MGIFVKSGVTSSGIILSNVYISFNMEPVIVFSKNSFGLTESNFMVKSRYKVYTNPEKTSKSDIQEEISVETTDIRRPIYDILYEELITMYPDSINMF
jgi:hypothetical protein